MVDHARLLPRDRIMGGLVGLVVGDALGVPVEFSRRHERDRDPVRGMRGYGTHAQPMGTWSDDGALALAHAAAFVEHGWDPAAHLRAFLAWFDRADYTAHGVVFDVGNATRQALARFRDGLPLTEIGGRADRDNGNGSLMRILPASCWWAGAPATAVIAHLGEASALTHAHVRSRLCCALHALIADGLLSRRPIIQALAEAGAALAPHVPAGERAVLAPLLDGSCLALDRAAVPSDGHVVSTLMAAVWCLHRHADFAEAVLEAVNLGDDTDTTGAVTGGLAGLRCGLSGIPRPWIACLPRRVALLGLAERFAEACLAAPCARPRR
jgi:ADP-ribosylglycohydrolase